MQNNNRIMLSMKGLSEMFLRVLMVISLILLTQFDLMCNEYGHVYLS